MPITPYAGTFAKPQLMHLLRRTMFGLTKADITYFTGMTMSQVIAALLTAPTPPPPPVNNYSSADPDIPFGTTWVGADPSITYESSRRNSLRAWWVGNMINQDRSITEKMILFWHNHIPTNFDFDPTYCYTYVELLRTYALGNFKTLMQEISINGSMLNYLNGNLNTKNAPNENYARELQELFTVGKDLSPHFTETDIQVAARVLTGWRDDPTVPFAPVYFDEVQHDTGNKTFSSFYNNTTIIGQSGPNSGINELNDLLDMIFAHQEVAKYIVRKIYRFFVYYNIDSTIESTVIAPLADTFRNNNYEIVPVLTELFGSQHFYDIMQVASHIKNPIDLNIGFIRLFNPTFSTATSSLYNSWKSIHNYCSFQDMEPGAPPSVSGWTAYYQSPNYHELWIDADSLRRKKEYVDRLLVNGFGGVAANVLAFTTTMTSPSDPDLLIAEVLELCHVLPSDQPLIDELKSILLSGQTSNYYWTNAWNAYMAAPTNMTNANIVSTRLKQFYAAVLTMAEAYLS